MICNVLNPAPDRHRRRARSRVAAPGGVVRAALDRAAIHVAAAAAEVVPAALGSRAEALGALALVLRDGDRFTVEMIGRTA